MLSSLPRHDWILSKHILLVCVYVGFAVLIPADTLSDLCYFSSITPHQGKENYPVKEQTLPCSLLQVHAFRKRIESSLHSFDAAHTDDQIWDRSKRWTECVLSPLLSRITLSCLALPFISKRCPSFSTAAFNHPLPCFLSPSSPPLFASRQRMQDELMQYTASPKGSWDFYCKDLIDWCLRQNSTSPLTVSLARELCASVFSFTHIGRLTLHSVKLCLRESLLTGGN